MIRKFRYGKPFPTDAVVKNVGQTSGMPPFFTVTEQDGGVEYRYTMEKEDCVFGLGEQMRGINKRGWHYDGYAYDDPHLTETRTSLYGAHNFIVVFGARTFGVFVDCGKRVSFDIGYTDPDELIITFADADVYFITGESVLAIVKTFRELIGQSYIPPKWAFGFGQSKWGYRCEEDIREVFRGYEEAELPLDMIYLDIDYMEEYCDFTVNRERFPDLKGLAEEFKEKGVRLIPIVDAAVKVKEGYHVYDEGVEKGYFCTDSEGKPYVVGVWPGDSVLPDVLNPEARLWFGSYYEEFLKQGIEGFWNDMNEPAIFYGQGSIDRAFQVVASKAGVNLDHETFNEVQAAFGSLANNPDDYAAMHHKAEGELISHSEVHNLYGDFLTRGAAEYFAERDPDRRYLLFSRSSYIGMHRYGGIWTGDNASWWSHLALNVKMMPSLDMCGFLFAGADLGGHAEDTTEDLMLRWLAFGIFTPLMRNHATCTARDQECYRFKDLGAFRHILSLRYRLLPYLYSEFVKCAQKGEMLFKPLCFEYPEDARARTVEDQLFWGESVMLAPVVEANAAGRYVYLPARMKLLRFTRHGVRERVMEKGEYYIDVPLDEVVVFLREGKVLPLAQPAKNVASLDDRHLTFLKFIVQTTEYTVCRDDGVTKSSLQNFETIKVQP